MSTPALKSQMRRSDSGSTVLALTWDVTVLYLTLARRIGLNVVGVSLPGHFVVKHVPAQGEAQLIDVFEGGVPLSRA